MDTDTGVRIRYHHPRSNIQEEDSERGGGETRDKSVRRCVSYLEKKKRNIKRELCKIIILFMWDIKRPLFLRRLGSSGGRGSEISDLNQSESFEKKIRVGSGQIRL